MCIRDRSYTWKSLPKIDSHGDPYLYTVEETPVSGFEVAYSQNNEQGIQIGDIEITNTRNGYVLPETGGMGNLFLIATGVLLIGACGIGYGLLQHRRRKRNQPAL